MLTWAIVFLVIRGMRAAKESKTAFHGDAGCLLMISIPADIAIFAVIAYAIIHIVH